MLFVFQASPVVTSGLPTEMQGLPSCIFSLCRG